MQKPTESFSRAVSCAALLLILASCATVPETGRRQMILVSAQDEMQLGLTEFEKLKQSTPISKDAAAAAMVKRVGQRVAAVAPLENASWEFVLFENPTPNAFCLPGGKVGVNSGILEITKTEAGLAAVIGHEVAHAVARHGAERISEGLLLQMGGQALAQAMQTQTQMTQQLVLGAYGIGANVGVALPHSRSQELEADHLGLLYMARAGYQPRAALDFWQRFKQYRQRKGAKEPVGFLSTHPLDEQRIEQIENLLPEAEAEFKAASKKRK